MRRCKVFYNDRFAGMLTEQAPRLYTFAYDEGYIGRVDSRPICLSMPLHQREYSSESLFPFFCNMLPEGVNRQFLLKLFHVSPDDEFGLLLKSASGDTVGAVSIKEI